MAEVVGLLASVVTLSEVIVKTAELGRKFRHAGEEVQALRHELNGFELILRKTEAFCGRFPESEGEFKPTLNEANALFQVISKLADKVSKPGGVGQSVKQKLQWSKSIKGRADALARQLRNIHSRIDTLLSLEAASRGHDNGLMVTQFRTDFVQWQQDSRNDITQLSSQSVQEHRHTRAAIAQQSRMVEQMVQEQRDTRAVIIQQSRTFEQIAQALTEGDRHYITLSTMQPVQEGQSQAAAMQQTLGMAAQIVPNPHSMRLLAHVLSRQLATTPGGEQSDAVHSTSQHSSPTGNVDLIRSTATLSTQARINIRSSPTLPSTSVVQRPYVTRCSCSCHSISYLSTPAAFASIIGRLHVGFKGNVLKRCVCASKLCKNHGRGARITVAYSTPPLLPGKRYSFHYSHGVHGSPERPWTIYNIIPPHSPALSRAQRGDIEGLKTLFRRGKAKPTDQNPGAESLLILAASHQQYDMCQFLAECGGDALAANKFGISAIEEAWAYELSTGASRDAILSRLPPGLADFTPAEDWELTALHEAALGLGPGVGVDSLVKVTADIDTPDARGRTPLWWASWCGDWATVCTLLDHGADPNRADCEGRPPLFEVAASGPIDLVDKMRQCGASVTATNYLGEGALWWVANERGRVERLIGPGVNLEQTNTHGWTPLLTACEHDRDEVARCLLEHGADPNKPNPQNKYTPLLWSVQNNSHRTLRLLLDRHVSCRNTDRWGQNLFMLACWKSNVTTMDILSSYGVGQHVDPHAVDEDGDTLFSYWIPAEIETRSRFNAFLRLLASGPCNQCTTDAKRGLPAAHGGCPHGVLDVLSLQDKIDDLKFWYGLEEDCGNSSDETESSVFDSEDGLSTASDYGLSRLFRDEPFDSEDEDERQQNPAGEHQHSDIHGVDSDEDEVQFVDAAEWAVSE